MRNENRHKPRVGRATSCLARSTDTSCVTAVMEAFQRGMKTLALPSVQ